MLLTLHTHPKLDKSGHAGGCIESPCSAQDTISARMMLSRSCGQPHFVRQPRRLCLALALGQDTSHHRRLRMLHDRLHTSAEIRTLGQISGLPTASHPPATLSGHANGVAQVGGSHISIVVGSSLFVNQAVAKISTVLPEQPRSNIVNAITGVNFDFLRSLPMVMQNTVREQIVDTCCKLHQQRRVLLTEQACADFEAYM